MLLKQQKDSRQAIH